MNKWNQSDSIQLTNHNFKLIFSCKQSQCNDSSHLNQLQTAHTRIRKDINPIVRYMLRYHHYNKVTMYECTMDQKLAYAAAQTLVDASCSFTRWQHLAVWNDVKPSPWKCDIKMKIWLRQSVHIYLRNISAKFHTDPIWNDGTLSFLKLLPQHQQEQKEQHE